MFVKNKLIISGNVAATADNIMNAQLLWRIGIGCDLFMHVCDIPLMLIFYILLKPVNKNLALLALLFTLIQTAVLVAGKLKLFDTLFLLNDADYLKVFQPRQLYALVYIVVKSDAYMFSAGLIFFGFACIVLGYLIFKSVYLPGFVGVLMLIAGLCYLIDSFATILFPNFANKIFPGILIPCFIAELSFCLWLIIKGVDVSKWNERSSLAAER